MWKRKLGEMLPLFGHRNWILVVDKAFPMQSAAGMTVVDSGEKLPTVLECVLDEIFKSTHVQPVIYTDKELEFVDDGMCAGAEDLRRKIHQSIAKAGCKPQTLLHEDVFSKLDAASKLFSVLVIKTEAVIPYTSVFIELDCGYWNGGKEEELRNKMR